MGLHAPLDVHNVRCVAVLGQQPPRKLPCQAHNRLIVSLAHHEDGLHRDLELDAAQLLRQLAYVPRHVRQLSLGQVSRLDDGGNRLDGLYITVNHRHRIILAQGLRLDVGLIYLARGLDHFVRVGDLAHGRRRLTRDQRMDIAGGRLVMLFRVGFDRRLLHRDEGGLATVAGVGIEKDLEQEKHTTLSFGSESGEFRCFDIMTGIPPAAPKSHCRWPFRGSMIAQISLPVKPRVGSPRTSSTAAEDDRSSSSIAHRFSYSLPVDQAIMADAEGGVSAVRTMG